MSGLSTTGSTVLAGLDTLPHALNMWRASLSWLGGMGIIVMAVAILPLLGIGGMEMYRSETPGPSRMPTYAAHRQTAQLLWFVYAGLTALAPCACGPRACAGSMPSATPSRRFRSARSPPTMPASVIFSRR